MVGGLAKCDTAVAALVGGEVACRAKMGVQGGGPWRSLVDAGPATGMAALLGDAAGARSFRWGRNGGEGEIE